MMKICMCDVGDGLNLFINHGLMVDFGGEPEKLKYHHHQRCCRCYYHVHHVETFVLSHFHKDHYNGLFLENLKPRFFNLKHVYYQGIPIIKDGNKNNLHTKFLSYLMAMNHYMLGDKSGIASADFIDRLQQLNQKHFSYAPLFKGDTFEHQGKKYEVIWPLRVIEEAETIAKIKTAIKDFEDAKNPELNKLAEKYKEIAEKYARNDENTDEKKCEYPNDSMQQAELNSEIINEATNREIDNPIQKANKSLRAAANDLSLAFKSTDNDLLFMGDLETNQINILCDELSDENFKVFVTPHHGTHAGVKMKKISSKIALSSVGGKKLYSGYLKNKYLKYVSHHLYNTEKDGCLRVSVDKSSVAVDMCIKKI